MEQKLQYQQNIEHADLVHAWVGASTEPSCSRKSWTYYDPIHPNLEAAISRLNVTARKVVAVRPIPSTAQPNLQASSEERIPEEEAVCISCFGTVRDQGHILKTDCMCRVALLHERCALAFSGNKNCVVCGIEVKNIPVTLLWMPSPAATESVESQKPGLFSRLKRLWLPLKTLRRRKST